jgi:hypothetical protein
VFKPVEKLLDQRIDAGPARVETEMRLFVGGAPLVIQALESGAVGGQRPAPVRRDARHEPIQRHIKPDRHAVPVDSGAVLSVRECSASCRDHQMPRRQMIRQNGPFDGAEIRLSMAGEDLGDRQPLPLLDELIDVDVPPVEPPCERARQRRLPGSHESDEIDLVGLHRITMLMAFRR